LDRELGTPKMASSAMEKIVGMTAKPMLKPNYRAFLWS
jgi:hypothetical protein